MYTNEYGDLFRLERFFENRAVFYGAISAINEIKEVFKEKLHLCCVMVSKEPNGSPGVSLSYSKEEGEEVAFLLYLGERKLSFINMFGDTSGRAAIFVDIFSGSGYVEVPGVLGKEEDGESMLKAMKTARDVIIEYLSNKVLYDYLQDQASAAGAFGGERL